MQSFSLLCAGNNSAELCYNGSKLYIQHEKMMLAERLKNIHPSATLVLAAEAARLKAEGHDVVSLALGEPDGNPPEWVVDAAHEALHQGGACHKYTPVAGMLSLRQAIADDVKRAYGIFYDAKQEIVVGVGAKQVIFNALMATLNPNDEVIIPSPYWVSYPEMVQLVGGKAVCISACDLAKNLEAAITPRTRWLILNSPSNPTGAVLSKEQLESLIQVLERHPHVHVLCDDIYQDLIYDGRSFLGLPMVAPASWRDRFVIVNGVSKAFAMTGWRIGYACGAKNIIQGIVMIQSQSSSNATTLSQMAAEAALRGSRDFLNGWRESYQKRRNICAQALQDMNMPFEGGHGAFYLLASCENWLGKRTTQGQLLSSDDDVAQYLLHQHLVAVVPGAAFGAPGFVRFSYATDDALLVKALDRMKKAYGELHD